MRSQVGKKNDLVREVGIELRKGEDGAIAVQGCDQEVKFQLR
jgi:hypothetical protein